MNSAANAMPIRRIDFGFDDDIDLIFFDGDPVLSYSSHAFWMTMPYLEPYLMRSVRAAMEDVQDPNLKEEMSRFCSQEGQHFQQHAKVNAILKSRFDEEGQQKLQRIEEELEAEFQHFSVEKDHAFNLAYAEAFECMTMSMSRTQMEMAIHERMKAPIKDLFFGTSRRRWSTGQWLSMPTALWVKAIYIVFDLADGQRSTTSVMSIVFTGRFSRWIKRASRQWKPSR